MMHIEFHCFHNASLSLNLKLYIHLSYWVFWTLLVLASLKNVLRRSCSVSWYIFNYLKLTAFLCFYFKVITVMVVMWNIAITSTNIYYKIVAIERLQSLGLFCETGWLGVDFESFLNVAHIEMKSLRAFGECLRHTLYVCYLSSLKLSSRYSAENNRVVVSTFIKTADIKCIRHVLILVYKVTSSSYFYLNGVV